MPEVSTEIPRALTGRLTEALRPGKVLVLLGARRTGKTIVLGQLARSLDARHLTLNGEDMSVISQLAERTAANYQSLFSDYNTLLIDEAQFVPDIGRVLKFIVDTLPHLQVVVTGSSAFDLENLSGAPLTGRKYTFHLHPLAESELNIPPIEMKQERMKRMVFGCYPEVHKLTTDQQRKDYLNEIVNSYLLKDILVFENIHNASRVFDLLRLVAFQVGQLVSYNDLGKQLSMSKNTVEKYLDLLSKVFVLFRVGGYSRNLRKEVVKNSKWYFFDNGIRNAVIASLQPLNLRNDVGQLWESYAITERLKHQGKVGMTSNNFFWRTYDQQEIDWVEERDARLFAYEMKWSEKKIKAPAAWTKAYPESSFETITPSNLTAWTS